MHKKDGENFIYGSIKIIFKKPKSDSKVGYFFSEYSIYI